MTGKKRDRPTFHVSNFIASCRKILFTYLIVFALSMVGAPSVTNTMTFLFALSSNEARSPFPAWNHKQVQTQYQEYDAFWPNFSFRHIVGRMETPMNSRWTSRRPPSAIQTGYWCLGWRNASAPQLGASPSQSETQEERSFVVMKTSYLHMHFPEIVERVVDIGWLFVATHSVSKHKTLTCVSANKSSKLKLQRKWTITLYLPSGKMRSEVSAKEASPTWFQVIPGWSPISSRIIDCKRYTSTSRKSCAKHLTGKVQNTAESFGH